MSSRVLSQEFVDAAAVTPPVPRDLTKQIDTARTLRFQSLLVGVGGGFWLVAAGNTVLARINAAPGFPVDVHLAENATASKITLTPPDDVAAAALVTLLAD